MHKSTRLLPAVAALMGLAACADPSAPTGRAPKLRITDADHHFGNIHFFWQAPTHDNAGPYNDIFNGTYYPIVSLCQWVPVGGGCVSGTEKLFNRFVNPKIYVQGAQERYFLSIPPSMLTSLSVGTPYRVRVMLMGSVMGDIDVDVVPNAAAAALTDTSNFTPYVVGSSLPVSFRMESQTAYIMEPFANEIDEVTGSVIITHGDTIVSGAGSVERALFIQPGQPGEYNTDNRLILAWHIGPDNFGTKWPFTVQLRYDPNNIGPFLESGLVVRYHLPNGSWVPCSNGNQTLDTTNHLVGCDSRFQGIYAVFGTTKP